jgi:hypothetical protein
MILPLLLAAAVEAPVTAVTVFANEAKVTRTTRLVASGETTVTFPTLPWSVDVGTIRLEAEGATVRRVDLSRARPAELSAVQAKPLVEALARATIELNRIDADLNAVARHLQTINELRPTAMPDEAGRPATRLNAGSWVVGAQALAELLTKAHAQRRALMVERQGAEEKVNALNNKAAELGAPPQEQGHQVNAVIEGFGAATLTLSYSVSNATWSPAWDLNFDPATNSVALALSANVRQTSGEDWPDSAVTVSTAIPSRATQAPTLASWKIGTAERFIPTPTRRAEYPRPLPAVAPIGAVNEAQLWRNLLQRGVAPQPQSTDEEPAEKPQRGRREEVLKRSYAPPPPKAQPLEPSPMPSSASPAADYSFQSEELAEPRLLETSSRRAAPPMRQFGLGPPPSWRPPSYAPDSPVVLAGGYELSFSSLKKERVPSGPGTRQVALLSQRWPVTVERLVFPAVADGAFLTAELMNPSTQVLPGGPARLSVGNDPSGEARLEPVAPQERFTLPLGLDRAIRPVRNVAVVESVEGVFAKDDVARYTVTIELVNPYRTPIALRVADQYPLTTAAETSTRLEESKPQAVVEQSSGQLEWRLTLAPQQKQTLSFVYTIKKPKGWRPQQSEVSK